MPYIVTTKRPCPACGQELEEAPSGGWRGHGDSEEPGHEGGGPIEDPWCIREDEPDGGAPPISRRAVATLEERHVFNADEWKAAGYDQPDGNLQFWHPALLLCRYTEQTALGTRYQELADVLWLHDGSTSRGHIVSAMGVPGELTHRLGSYPDNWPERVIPESGGTITLPDGTVIEVEALEVWQLADRTPGCASGPDDDRPSEAEVIAAFNAREQAQGKEKTR
jgi:hypothetical protein